MRSGLPSWISQDAIEDTLRVFQPFYPVTMTRDDAVAILLNVGNLFAVLKGDSREEI